MEEKNTIVRLKENINGITVKRRINDVVSFEEVEFNNYFYILKEDFDSLEERDYEYFVKDLEYIEKNECLMKLILKNNYHRNLFRRKLEEEFGFKTFEADIDSCKRYILDNQFLDLAQKNLKFLFVDIETLDINPLSKDETDKVIAIDPVLCFAAKDFNDKVFFDYNNGLDNFDKTDYKKKKQEIIKLANEGEKDLLLKFIEVVKDYDVLLAWHGDKFDFAYLRQRLEKYGLDYEGLMINDMDYELVYKKNNPSNNTEGTSLNVISNFEFKDEAKDINTEVGKIDWRAKTGYDKYYELFIFNLELMKEYNIQDVNLMLMIERKLKLLEIHKIVTKISHCLISDTMANSRVIDILLLNEYHKKNIIKNSKPSKVLVEQREHPITGEFSGGGYTECFEPNLYKNIERFDFFSHYPNAIITHNISPELFVENKFPRLELVFNDIEIKFINEVIDSNKKFLNNNGKLNLKKYNNNIDLLKNKYNIKKSMHDFMWEFTDKYNDKELNKYIIDKNLTMTSADFNLDTRGWNIHPHRLFKRENGILPEVCKNILVERGEVKASLKNFPRDSIEYQEKNIYQTGLKTLILSIYGFFGLKSARDFNYDISDSITATSRYLTKKIILLSRKNGMFPKYNDTDSIYMDVQNKDINYIKVLFFDFFNEWIKDYNPYNTYNIPHPITNQLIVCNHSKILEYENKFDALINVKKKRYYFRIGNRIESKGGFLKKKDTLAIAKELQKELCTDLLNFTYDKEKWKHKLLLLRKKVFEYKLELKDIIKHQSLSKNINEYGKNIIDSKTGDIKYRADGKPQFAPIPAHIKVAKKMISQGITVDVGDDIKYIIHKSSPRIIGITIEEYAILKKYDPQYYWKSIISPLLEIFRVVEPKNIYTFYSQCWNYSQQQLDRLIEVEEEEEN